MFYSNLWTRLALPPPPTPPLSGVVQGYVSLGYLCKYVNQRLVGWDLCGTCNCTIDHFFLLGGQENKVTTPRCGVTLQSVPVSFFFNTEKYTNLFMLSFFFLLIVVVGVQQFIASQSKKKFCKYIFSLLFLRQINCCKTEP